MSYFKLDPSRSNVSVLTVNAINRLRLAKQELESAEALLANMSDQEIFDDVGFTGTGAQLQATMSSAVASLNDVAIVNLLESLNW